MPKTEIEQFMTEMVSDRQRFIETLVQIKDEQKRVLPFLFKAAQVDFHNNRSRRNIIVKARQLGMSSVILCDMLIDAITIPGTVCVCISHETEATQRLLERVRYFYNSIHDKLKPKLGHDAAFKLSWPSIDSSFYIGTVRAAAFSRGDTIHRLHLSEPAHYPPDVAAELLTAALQSAQYGEITLESSPRGTTGPFYGIYQGAKEGLVYKPFFYPWWWEHNYSMTADDSLAGPNDRGQLEYDDEEMALIEKHTLTENQIRWRRYKILELKLANPENPDIFRQEFPENDIDCWMTSKTNVFDLGMLRGMLLAARKPIQEEGYLKIWKLPHGGNDYLLSVDAAGGSPRGDFSVAVVLEPRNCEIVAVLRARIPIEAFTEQVYQLGLRYNRARIVAEDEKYGYTLLTILKRRDYPHLYHRDQGKKLGWRTDMRTRRILIDETSGAINTRTMINPSENFIEEAMNFHFVGGKEDHLPSAHDDELFATMIALAIRNSGTMTLAPMQSKAEPSVYAPAWI